MTIKKFNEMDFEVAKKRSIERQDRFPNPKELKRGMCCLPKDEKGFIETRLNKLYDRFAYYYVEHCKDRKMFEIFDYYLMRARNHDISLSELRQEYIQDLNYVGEVFNDLRKEIGKINWAEEIE